MKEYDLLSNYKTLKKRLFSKNYRNIKNRILASYKNKEFYDGQRCNGYGGYKYDGRWQEIAKKIFVHYKLKNNAKILQIGCDKGFLLQDIKNLYPDTDVYGIENTLYPIKKASKIIKKKIKFSNYINLPFKNNFFDFVIAIGPVYSLNLSDAIKCLKEINRVGKGKSFITLGSYENQKDYNIFKSWTLLGSTILKKREWKQVLQHAKYKGDYKFNTARSLNLLMK